MFCPGCRSEFTAGIEYCKSCEVDLVDELDAESIFRSAEAMTEALDGKELRPIMASTHVELEAVQEFLASRQIASILANQEDSGVQPGMASNFYLLVSVDDFEKAGEYVNNSFHKELQKEGIVKDVELGDYQVCPACGADLADDMEECPECGLYVGVGEE